MTDNKVNYIAQLGEGGDKYLHYNLMINKMELLFLQRKGGQWKMCMIGFMN